MRLAIPLEPPTLDEALGFTRALSLRPEVAAGPIMTAHQWDRAVVAAVTRRDRDGLAILLQAELVPNLASALQALATALRCARACPEGPPDEHVLDLADRIEPTSLAVMRAGKAVWAAEKREELLPEGPAPQRPRPGASSWVLAKATHYLEQQMDGGGACHRVTEDLGRALCRVAGPARVAIRCIDTGALDDLPTPPLQTALLDAFNALSAVRLYHVSLLLAEVTACEVLTARR
ncbi:MAG: hypothetical protein KDK70_00010 [Myxococcales bacterium]|nr:hypothetical protein [Myxococcales bacterium]